MRTSWIRWTFVSLFVSMPLAAQDTNRVALVVGLHGPGVLVPISSTTALRPTAPSARRARAMSTCGPKASG